MVADLPQDELLSLVTVVCVLFNSAEVIEDCLCSVPAATPVVLVDNASQDAGLSRARAVRPDATVVASPRNAGFGAGCNLGWRAAATPYVAFLNPDARLRPGALSRLVACVAARPHTIAGPALLDATGAVRPAKSPATLRREVLGRLPSAARWAPEGWNGKLPLAHPVHRGGGCVSAVEGACFVMAAEDLRAIGGFDEDLFLYWEEESLALRIRQRGGSAVYVPEAVVEHVGETSTGQVRALAAFHRHRSLVVFLRKRDGARRARVGALAVMAAEALAGAVSLLNAVAGRARPRTPLDHWHALRGLVAGLTARLEGEGDGGTGGAHPGPGAV